MCICQESAHPKPGQPAQGELYWTHHWQKVRCQRNMFITEVFLCQWNLFYLSPNICEMYILQLIPPQNITIPEIKHRNNERYVDEVVNTMIQNIFGRSGD